MILLFNGNGVGRGPQQSLSLRRRQAFGGPADPITTEHDEKGSQQSPHGGRSSFPLWVLLIEPVAT